jgi:hypothetical protein
MDGNLEALRAHLERLSEVARPDDRLRLQHSITLIRQAEAARAKRQAVDGAAWRYGLDKSAVRDETGNAFDKMIQQLSLRS